MKYDFSAQFLRILPPDTSFGDAWESFCFELLCAEQGSAEGLTRLMPPDRGVDILHRGGRAYQCKSLEEGAFGTLAPESSIESLTQAFKHRGGLGWREYCLATNAYYSGAGLAKILQRAEECGLGRDGVRHLGPQHWVDLCDRHFEKVRHRLDYRISATVDQVVGARRSAGYFEKHVVSFAEQIRRAQFRLVITNNRTPLEIEIPFSPELSVENYLDTAKGLLGISLDWSNFADLGTSAGPSLSVTINQYSQPFSARIRDLPISSGDPLQLWVKVVWRDEPRNEQVLSDRFCYMLLDRTGIKELPRKPVDPIDRRELTLSREEAMVQAMIWNGARGLVGNRTPVASSPCR